MALTPEQIDRLIQQADGLAPKEGSIFRTLVKLTEAAVGKQDDELIQQMVEALEGAQKHHSTTSLPLAIQNFGSREACGQFETELWRKRIPAVITAGRARLQHLSEEKV